MRSLAEAKAFANTFEIFEMPSLRIIGLEARCGGELGNTAPALWGNVFQSSAEDTFLALPRWKSDCLFGWHCDYDAETDTFVYMVCVLSPAGAEVPPGFSFRDIPATPVALGLYGEDSDKTIARARALGFEPNGAPYGWNAELYFRKEEAHPPKSVKTPWRWLVPVKPMNA